MDLFLFGTLLHMPLLEVVSGDKDVRDRVSWATRKEYRVSRVSGHVFPIMHAHDGGVVEGVIVSGLSDDALERLDYYEKAFDYDRVDFVVLDADKQPRNVTAYVPAPDRWTPAEPWDCAAWIAKFGDVTTLAAAEAMSVKDQMPALQMGQLYPQMMSRAASRQRAGQSPNDGRMADGAVQLLKTHHSHRGFFNVDEIDLTFRRFDGAMSEPVNRTVFIGVDCAIVLPYDPVRDRVMVVEQFRAGAYMRGDPNPWTIEPIAGRIDPGEEPDAAARREALEEAGIELRDLKCVSAAYPSPGTTTEHFFVYVGLCDLPDGSEGIGGEVEENEDIRSHVMEWDDFDHALNSGKFRLLPLLVAGHWLARNRATLRATA